MKLEKLQANNKLIFINYLQEVKDDFSPPLSQRISENSNVKDINEYCEKLLSKANVFATFDRNKIVGVIAIYTNNRIKREAYIPILSVMNNYKGRGIASRLLETAVSCAHENKMKIVHVKTWPENKNAISLYKKNKFKIIKQDESSLYLKREIQ